MRTSLEVVNAVRVDSPCHASWEAMTGDGPARFCDDCQKTVHNLSELTAGQAADLIRGAGGPLCVRYTPRADGTVLTRERPAGVRERLWRTARGLAALAAACAAVVLLPGCGRGLKLPKISLFGSPPTTAPAVMGGMQPPPGTGPVTGEVRPIMGGMRPLGLRTPEAAPPEAPRP